MCWRQRQLIARAAQESEPIVETAVINEPRIGRVVRFDMARALAEDDDWI